MFDTKTKAQRERSAEAQARKWARERDWKPAPPAEVDEETSAVQEAVRSAAKRIAKDQGRAIIKNGLTNLLKRD